MYLDSAHSFLYTIKSWFKLSNFIWIALRNAYCFDVNKEYFVQSDEILSNLVQSFISPRIFVSVVCIVPSFNLIGDSSVSTRPAPTPSSGWGSCLVIRTLDLTSSGSLESWASSSALQPTVYTTTIYTRILDTLGCRLAETPESWSPEFQLDVTFETILVIFADKSCIFADNFLIWPKLY